MISVSIGAVSLQYVKYVQPAKNLARDAFVAAGAGAPSESIEIKGYILGTPGTLLAQKTSLENSLVALGDTTLTIQFMGTIDGRIESIQWDAYSTGPMWLYTIRFGPKAKGNPFAGLIKIGALTLNNPVPSLTEQFRVVSDDDKMDTTHSRAFRLSGRFMGSPSEVEDFLEDLRDAITTPANGYFTLTTPQGTFEARARDLQFDRPEEIETQRAVTYTATLETRADYSLETFNLPHQQVSVGGITWDVVTSFSHNVERLRIGTSAILVIKSESMTWGLKKYFGSIAAADAFKTSVDALVRLHNVMASPTGQQLECKSVSYNTPVRDGYTTIGDRRYSLSVSISFSKSTGRQNPSGSAFGISFYEITSDSRGITVDENGGLRSRTRNVSGRVLSLPPTSLLGSAVVEADGTYYVTGLNLGKIDDEGFWEISISGRTLDSESECAGLIEEFFEGVLFNDVSSKSKSVSLNQVGQTAQYAVSSASETITGYVWHGNGNAILALVTLAGTTWGAGKLTNASVGKQEPWTVPGTKECTYRQSVSLTRNTNYQTPTPPEDDESEENPAEQKFDKDQPDIQEEVTTEIRKQTNRYQPVTIPGGDIVLKKVGVNLAGARVRVQRTARNFRIYNGMSYPGTPGAPGALNDPREESNVQGEQGLTKWREVSWISGSVS